MANEQQNDETRQGPRVVPRLRSMQEAYGYLPRPKLENLAAELEIPLHRIHEIISFFPHYRLKPGPAIHIRVCRDLACDHAGSVVLKQRLEALVAEFGSGKVVVEWTSCLGLCDKAPAVQAEFEALGRHPIAVDDGQDHPEHIVGRMRDAIERFSEGRTDLHDDADLKPAGRPRWQLNYRNSGELELEEFAAVKQFAARLVAAPSPEARLEVMQSLNNEMKSADLRGMGGAGVPTFRKWLDVRSARGENRYVVCNADESEPLTFKDRELLLQTPDIVLEGMIFGALYSGATQGYVYIRHEYPAQIRAMEKTIKRAHKAGVLGKNILGTGHDIEIEVFVSPGGYVCGEQSALIEAIEEKRSEPRNKPPQIETNGIYDCPTLLNNVETFAWVPSIYHHGGAWYAGSGVQGGPWYGRAGRRSNATRGMRFFSLCGDLRRPGVHEVPNGTTLRELIDRCGGLLDNAPLFAFAPSGPSGGFLPARLTKEMIAPEFHRAFPAEATHLDVLDIPLDLDEYRTLGLMLGAGMMVYADRPGKRPDILGQALAATRFYRRESCGKCVPCRVGCQKLVEIGENLVGGSVNKPTHLLAINDLVRDLSDTLELTSICGLGTSAPKPISSYLAYFQPYEDQRAEP